MTQNRLDFDALILAGGRSSRLGGVPKQGLVFHGATLLQRSLAASAGATRTVVIGPPPGPLPDGVMTCRESPEFSGPASAVAAGLAALSHEGTSRTLTLVLACDMPLVSAAVQVLTARMAETTASGAGCDGAGPTGGRFTGDGVMACADDGRAQPLAGLYRTTALAKAVHELAASQKLINASMRSLLASLDVQLVTVPKGSTADVDTWDDAVALGISTGRPENPRDVRGDGILGGNS